MRPTKAVLFRVALAELRDTLLDTGAGRALERLVEWLAARLARWSK